MRIIVVGKEDFLDMFEDLIFMIILFWFRYLVFLRGYVVVVY